MRAQRTISITQSGTLNLAEIGLWGGDLDQDLHVFIDDWYFYNLYDFDGKSCAKL